MKLKTKIRIGKITLLALILSAGLVGCAQRETQVSSCDKKYCHDGESGNKIVDAPYGVPSYTQQPHIDDSTAMLFDW